MSSELVIVLQPVFGDTARAAATRGTPPTSVLSPAPPYIPTAASAIPAVVECRIEVPAHQAMQICGCRKICRSFSGNSGRLVEGIMGVVSGKIKMPGAI